MTGFRFKAAIAGLVSVQVVAGAWFAGWLPISGFGIIVCQFFLLAAVQVVLAARNDAEPPDERDRAIWANGAALGYVVALAGLAATLAALSAGVPSAALGKIVLAAAALADGTRYLAIIIGYRTA